MALNCNSSSVTAIGNDEGYAHVFARQLEAFAGKGDVVFALSTSGNSENVIRGIELAMQKGCHVIGVTGKREGEGWPTLYPRARSSGWTATRRR